MQAHISFAQVNARLPESSRFKRHFSFTESRSQIPNRQRQLLGFHRLLPVPVPPLAWSASGASTTVAASALVVPVSRDGEVVELQAASRTARRQSEAVLIGVSSLWLASDGGASDLMEGRLSDKNVQVISLPLIGPCDSTHLRWHGCCTPRCACLRNRFQGSRPLRA